MYSDYSLLAEWDYLAMLIKLEEIMFVFGCKPNTLISLCDIIRSVLHEMEILSL